MVENLKDMALKYSSWVHELGKKETEKTASYSSEKALERIANDTTLDKEREKKAGDLINSCFAAVSDYDGQPNVQLRQDLVYALRTAAELIGPNGTKNFKDFGIEDIKVVADFYNEAVQNAYDRGSMIHAIAVESYDPVTEKPELKTINLDKDKKLVA